MPHNFQGRSNQVAEYLASTVKLDAVEIMTRQLNAELADSQRIMNEIKVIFDSIPTTQNPRQEPATNDRNHEDVSTFLNAEPPRLLMPDMVNYTTDNADIDLDDVIATMRSYVEGLKKTALEQTTGEKLERKSIDDLDLTQYATSLGQLSKRLANLKLNKKNEGNTRNDELETKLAQLCENVNMFTQMVETKKSLSESNKSCIPAHNEDSAGQYEEIIIKLLSGLNELTYLLQNKH